MATTEIAIFGAGAWGTALAIHIARQGHQVVLWSYDPAVMTDIATTQTNQRYLPGIIVPDNLQVVVNIQEAAMLAHWLIVVPSHAFTTVLSQAWSINSKPQHLLWATKGLCPQTGGLLHEAARDIVGPTRGLAMISGPSFAREVALGMPTALTLATSVASESEFWQACLASHRLSIDTTYDLIGVQIGGCVKNVIALAAGMSDGLGYGANARCALITRGLTEMIELALCLGADSRTLTGLSGIGDLILTCTDNQSRNRRCGYALGQGKSLPDIQQTIGQVIEGITAAEQVNKLAQTFAIKMAITEMMVAVLRQAISPQEALNELLFH